MAEPIPPDDPRRSLVVADPEDPGLRRVGVVGDTYTILLSGAQTAGRYCLIDMWVPPGGGPPPHRHDFEETFTLLEGELEFVFRGETLVVPVGTTINVPANAPHAFKNVSPGPARMLCLCAPAGLEAFFLAAGDPVASRTAAAPPASPEATRAKRERMLALMPEYRMEVLL